MPNIMETEKQVLEEFLNEDPDMTETMSNLGQLLAHLSNAPVDTVRHNTLLNIRMALNSLTILNNMMDE